MSGQELVGRYICSRCQRLCSRVKRNFCEDGDIGGIIINGGELMGVRVFPNDAKDPFGDGKTTKYIGHAGNCRDYYISGGTTCKDPNDALRNNLEFIHDFKEGKLYLRCEDGNPADIFKTIRACRNGNIVYGVLTNSQSNRFDTLRSSIRATSDST
ncbi:MAG: hypothetical protein ACLUFM_03735 [Lachnospiraceae bacterium]